jgi:hypothetical protein
MSDMEDISNEDSEEDDIGLSKRKKNYSENSIEIENDQVSLCDPESPIIQEKSKRTKEYPANTKGPFVVFLRATDFPLKSVRISLSLQSKFKSVLGVTKVSRNKLRIVFNNRDEANMFCKDGDFREYRVYIPAADVECYGVIYCDPDDAIQEILSNQAKGKFKNPNLSYVDILESFNFTKLVKDSEGNETRVPTNFTRVTFAGTALPDYITIGHLLIPVDLYKPKPMFCTKCQSFGHTSFFCSKKEKCDNCLESHQSDKCSKPKKCQYCGDETLHNMKDCEKYKKKKTMLNKRAKVQSQISYARVTSGYYDNLTEFYDSEEECRPSTSANVAKVPIIRKTKAVPRAIKRRRTEIDSIEQETFEKVTENQTQTQINIEKATTSKKKPTNSGKNISKSLLSSEEIFSFIKNMLSKFIMGLGLASEWQTMILNFILPFVKSIITRITDSITNIFTFNLNSNGSN